MVDAALVSRIVGDTGLVVALAIFILLTLRRNQADVSRLSTFKFWISVAIIAWLLGEVAFIYRLSQYGVYIHATAMAIFALIILIKSKVFFKR